MEKIKTNKVMRLACLTIMWVACVIGAAAQQVITGNVTDAKFNEPIIGANVVLVNTQNRYVKHASLITLLVFIFSILIVYFNNPSIN